MTRSLALVSLLALALAAPATAEPVEWKVDPAHSRIGFSVRHLGISKVEGQFNEFSAEVMADEKTGRLASVEATVKTASVDTGIDKRDEHLRSGDFFGSDEYPEMRLKTRSIRFMGDRFTTVADLTIKGNTRPVRFTGEFLGAHAFDFGGGKKLRAGYEATATIQRKKFGLNFNRLAEGVAMVGDQVEIQLAVEMAIE